MTVEGRAASVGTDRDGWFAITAELGATLVFQSARFETGIALVTSERVDDVVLLLPSAEVIEIVAEAPPVVPGAARLDRGELQRVPGTGGDIVRALTVMPGVVNQQLPVGYSGVAIRGASPQDSKVFIDNFEVPILFHGIGFRAVTPVETIESLEFIPGGFDVAYGRASSGIVKLTTRRGGEERSQQAEVSLLDGGVLARGSAGTDTQYMLAVRRSTIDLVVPAVLPDDIDLSLTTVPRYWDGQVRVDHRLGDAWDLTLSGLATDDIFELVGSRDESASEKRFFNRTRFARVTANAHYHDGPWTADLALSGLQQQFVLELGAFQYIRLDKTELTPRVEVRRTVSDAAGLSNVVLRAGAEAPVGRWTADVRFPREPREGEPMDSEFDDRDISTSVTADLWTPNAAAWTALEADLQEETIRTTLGLRIDRFGRSGDTVVQPRGELAWRFATAWTARLSAGVFARPPEYQSELLARTARAERSLQTIAGLQWQPREGLRAQASLYYTDRWSLITTEDPLAGTLGNRGRGRSLGGEILTTLRQGPWFAWLAYSLSRSERIDRPGEATRLFSYDQPHSLNAAVSWQRGKWQLGGRFQVYSGLPYTPALGAVLDSDLNLYVPLYGDPNSERAQTHHQLDLRVDRTWQVGPVALTGFLDVQNVYANASIVSYLYSFDFSQRAAFRTLPIIPSLGVRGVF